MDADHKRQLINWITDHYNAPAFSDEFNNRFKASKASEKIGKILKNQSAGHISSLFIQVEPEHEGLPEGQPYDLNTTLLHEAEVDVEVMAKLEELRDKVDVALKNIDGVELNGSVILSSEADISPADYRQLNLFAFAL